ncbi:hypothetical protein PCANC_20748 [Puccinia coronata f. sp. avenae]|uniref:Uncharacterized protein n=1 Tax=Puccinia coronata f. sp. avenae TaxID=200324 RepID=A0A2N5U6M1_9BASI|nr:hypothetical protein PCANC_20748 [Puccinia coronata f. sp. avenae]
MAASNINSDAAIRARFSGSEWADQVWVGLMEVDPEVSAKKEKLAKFLTDKEVLRSYRDCALGKDGTESIFELMDELFSVIRDKEALQAAVAESLGKSYEDLRGTGKTELGLLTLLWKAKTDLFALAVDVWAERQPLITTQAGNTLGTRLKEKILAAIKQRKGPVQKAIKLFNTCRRDYLQKVDPCQLQLPENQDLTFNEFLWMDLDDPLWCDGHFYHSRAPWATDPNTINDLENSSSEEPIRKHSTPFPYESVERLWHSTRSQYTGSNHPWFDVVRSIKEKLTLGVDGDIDDTLERADFNEEDPDPPDDEERGENHDWVTVTDINTDDDAELGEHEQAAAFDETE